MERKGKGKGKKRATERKGKGKESATNTILRAFFRNGKNVVKASLMLRRMILGSLYNLKFHLKAWLIRHIKT
jgi:hypothetical protein